MKNINVEKLNGIQENMVDDIGKVFNVGKNAEILLSVMYFKSDEDKDAFTLDALAEEFLKIYPQNELSWNEYKRLHIRTILNAETKNVADGKMSEDDRLFYRVGKGIWCATEKGYEKAKKFLRDNELYVYKLQN